MKHMTTGEGGMIISKNDKIKKIDQIEIFRNK